MTNEKLLPRSTRRKLIVCAAIVLAAVVLARPVKKLTTKLIQSLSPGGIAAVTVSAEGCDSLARQATVGLSDACNGKSFCIYALDPHLRGPSGGCTRPLVVTWRCGEGEKVFESTAARNLVRLQCRQ